MVVKEVREPDNTLPLPLTLGLAMARAKEVVTNRLPFQPPAWALDPNMTSDALLALSDGCHYDPTDAELAGADLKSVGIEPRDISKGLSLEHLRAYRYEGIDFGSTATDAGASVSLYKRHATQADGWLSVTQFTPVLDDIKYQRFLIISTNFCVKKIFHLFTASDEIQQVKLAWATPSEPRNKAQWRRW